MTASHKGESFKSEQSRPLHDDCYTTRSIIDAAAYSVDVPPASVKSDGAESSASKGSGPVDSYTGRILVEDASGARFYVHEYRGRRMLARTKRYMLDTGEAVRPLDDDTFEIATTGERLTRAEE
jgi:hypothetical protein